VKNGRCHFKFLKNNTNMEEVGGMSEMENKLDVNCRTLAKFCVVMNVGELYLWHSC
jgi:hypothetical protein